jgi:hypothetical protein
VATHSDPGRARSRRGAAGLALALLLALPACGPPQVAPMNRRIVLALATATSARSPEWLEACAGQVAERRAAGALADAEHDAFAAILADARAGRWDRARDAAYALRDAQEPTPETVQAVKDRTLPEPVKLEPRPRRASRS